MRVRFAPVVIVVLVAICALNRGSGLQASDGIFVREGASWVHPEAARAIAVTYWEFTPRVVDTAVVEDIVLGVQTDGTPDSIAQPKPNRPTRGRP